MSHRLSRGLSDAFAGPSTRRELPIDDRPVRYVSARSRDYPPRESTGDWGDYIYSRPSDEYISQEEEIPRFMRRESSGVSGRRSLLRSKYNTDEPVRRVSAFESPGHSSSKTPDISDSSRTSRHQKSSHVIEDSRPPRTSRIVPSGSYQTAEIIYGESPRRPNSTSSRRSRSKSSPGQSRLSRIFGGSSSRTVSPEKPPRAERRSRSEKPSRHVQCVVCMEDTSLSRGADLKCGHRMCNSCLRRIFRMSTNDPQHMPPRCCGPEHIPLKYVDKLFDSGFKKNWNRKFEEYTSRNRLYCPSKGCGEWIDPDRIRKEDGRKIGKCGRCKTKVCGKCGKKWHASPKCGTDEETRQFLSQAADEGWKRCYRCKAMVERKEGCNHMTCRCGAEFCIICGVKWKGCDCPWFSHDATGADYLENTNIPGRHPRTYGEEMRARRLQELRDGVVARNMQYSGHPDDYNMSGGLGDITGIGNAAGHFMNENYRREPPPVRQTRSGYGGYPERRFSERIPESRGRPRRASPPAPPLRPYGPMAGARGLDDDRRDAGLSRARSERVVPSRSSRRYEDEAAAHSPRYRRHVSEEPTAKSSAMAGLNGKGRGANRVAEWRSFVEPGLPEGESVVGHPR